MNDDRNTDFWIALERRVSDMDTRLSNLQRDYQRDYTDLSRDIKENTGRVNNGLSPSIQKALQDNSDIKLTISDLKNTVEKTVGEMRSIVRESTDLTKLMIANFEQHKLKPVEDEVGFMKKTFVYGVVGMVIVFFGQMGLKAVFDRLFHDSSGAVAAPHAP